MNGDTCQLCGAVGPDKRTLVMRYFYELTEVVPEMSGVDGGLPRYSLRTCKHCRALFLVMLGEWRSACLARRVVPKDHDGNDTFEDPEAAIPVRVLGTVVMMTEEQYDEYRRNA